MYGSEIYAFTKKYRISGDFMTILEDPIPKNPVEKCHMNMGPILKGYGVVGI
jgi:hypothetical protein